MDSNIYIDLTISFVKNNLEVNKYESDYIKVNVNINPTSDALDTYKCNVELLKHDEPDEVLLFIRGYEKTLYATGKMLEIGHVQYLHILLR